MGSSQNIAFIPEIVTTRLFTEYHSCAWGGFKILVYLIELVFKRVTYMNNFGLLDLGIWRVSFKRRNMTLRGPNTETGLMTELAILLRSSDPNSISGQETFGSYERERGEIYVL